jgi:hypothetical protein
MYAMEWMLPKMLESHGLLESDPQKAQYYLIPHHSTCLYHRCVFHQNKTTDECKSDINTQMLYTLNTIRNEFPYWNRTEGRDHLIILTWDQASEVEYYSVYSQYL